MKKSIFKRIGFYFSSLFIFLLHLPFVFAKNKPATEFRASSFRMVPAFLSDSLLHATLSNSVSSGKTALSALYDTLKLNLMGLSRQAYEMAMDGYHYLVKTGRIANDKIISIVDFSLPSSQKRLFVIDLDNSKLLFNTYVAHGVNSGRETASDFSNRPESNKSSLGFYETRTTYMGGNGYSLRLEGLEPGINDNAARRDIVVHGAAYVSEDLVRSQGYIGRSWGCPAVPEKLHKPIIDKIKNGTCMFIYSNNRNYLEHSRILHHPVS